MRPVGVVEFGVDDFVFEAKPDAGILAAVVGAAGDRAMGVDGAA